MNEEAKPAPCYHNSDRTLFAILGFVAGVVAFFGGLIIFIGSLLSANYCNVAVVDLHDILLTHAQVEAPLWGEPLMGASSEYIVRRIEETIEDEDMIALVLDIDSPGGLPVAAQEVARAVQSMPIPTVAIIRSLGASAAYWAATGADKIYASELSMVGSIGVTGSYTDAAEYNENEGYTFNELSSGQFKDMGNPNKPLTEEERALLERDLSIMYDVFVDAVVENRGLERNTVLELADGSVVLGKMAREQGLVDEIGGYPEVYEYLSDLIGVEPVFCK